MTRSWKLTCLICGYKSGDLVGIQEHAMEEHGYTQADHQNVRRRQHEDGGLVFTMPDGVDWMRAVAEMKV